ncbi:MAG TPA: thiolase family protein [Candidatus Tumulicola sp.]|nr:thiolase family protein [Candidatus Tumulicola sp.]
MSSNNGKRDAVIVSAARTPVGNFGSAYREYDALKLGTVAAKAAIERSGIGVEHFDEVIFGSGGQPIEFANIARQISLEVGIPIGTPAYSVQRNCASGIQSIANAVQGIASGDGDVYLVGGTENQSMAPYIIPSARWGARLRPVEMLDPIWTGLTDHHTGLLMGETAELLAEEFTITREMQDQLAVESHNKAFRAQRMGKFNDELVHVQVPKKVGEPETVAKDEGPQAGLSVQKLSLYPAVFKKGGTVTPGNSCPLNDAGAALVVISAEKAEKLGVKPLARIRSYAFAGCDPRTMGLGPTVATPKALARAGITLDDIELVEFNEAFAAQYLACEKIMELDRSIVNVNGGAIALGHPIGATGARLTTTLVFEMRRQGKRFGLVTMCIGGGQGGALVIENAEAA